MREDQIQRLRELSEKIAEVVLQEADPDAWPGAGKPLAEIDAKARGDRYWCKKNAAASFSLLERSMSLLKDASGTDPNGKPHERPELDADIKQAERDASKALEEARKRAAGIVRRSKANG